MKPATAILLLFAATALPVAAADLMSNKVPSFGPTGMSISNVEPGARVVWMTLTRERVANHSKLRIQRGLEVAAANGKVVFTRTGADASHTIWLAAAIDDEESLALDATSPGYSKSTFSISTSAVANATGITVESREAEIIYVRRQVGAWFLSAMDGGLGDQDGDLNTVIAIPLQSLQPFAGNPGPPTAVAAGDIILILDPYSNRTAMRMVSE